MHSQISGHIVNIDRLDNTPTTGNPRWAIALAHGFGATTKPDAAVGYAITGNETGPVLLTLDNGQVIDLELIGNQS